MLTVLTGGTGGAKLVDGLARSTDEELRIIVNTADDEVFYGLYVSPDVDTIVYTLAGLVDEERGWGVKGDTFNCLAMLERLGLETWFRIGDVDLAMHVFRTMKMREERMKLSEVTDLVTKRLGIRACVIPMTDDRVRTMVDTGSELLPFQRYFVEKRASTPVKSVFYEGLDTASPAPGVLESIAEARAVILAPSNPVVSIGPILGVKGVREALRASSSFVVAVSPIVGGRALKGPADVMLRSLNVDPSPVGVASLYADFLDAIVIDLVDEKLRSEIESMGIRCEVTDTIMKTAEDRKRLAEFVLSVVKKYSR